MFSTYKKSMVFDVLSREIEGPISAVRHRNMPTFPCVVLFCFASVGVMHMKSYVTFKLKYNLRIISEL
jgi:hypothetical protein